MNYHHFLHVLVFYALFVTFRIFRAIRIHCTVFEISLIFSLLFLKLYRNAKATKKFKKSKNIHKNLKKAKKIQKKSKKIYKKIKNYFQIKYVCICSTAFSDPVPIHLTYPVNLVPNIPPLKSAFVLERWFFS